MIHTEEISYLDEKSLLEGFAAYPSKKKSPLVILCHAWGGRDALICEKAKSLAALGYVGFALDMYGKGISGNSKEENAALKRPFLKDRAFLKKRVLRGFEVASSLSYVDAARIAVLGFGFGAVCALDLARSGANLKGAISVYGHFDSPFPTQAIKAKVLILHGYDDPVSPLSDLIVFQEELDEANIDWQAHIYGNTFHAFTSPTANDPDAGIVYHPASAARAWKAITAFLEEVLSL
jgi:dienelactone hydrolase